MVSKYSNIWILFNNNAGLAPICPYNDLDKWLLWNNMCNCYIRLKYCGVVCNVHCQQQYNYYYQDLSNILVASTTAQVMQKLFNNIKIIVIDIIIYGIFQRYHNMKVGRKHWVMISTVIVTIINTCNCIAHICMGRMLLDIVCIFCEFMNLKMANNGA